MTFRIAGFLALGLTLLVTPATFADAKDLAGTYKVEGTNPAGQKYEGTVEIVAKGGKTFEVTWKIGRQRDIGLGTLNGNTLEVEYQGKVKEEREGKARYKVHKDGSLEGIWFRKGDRKNKGTETLTPQK